VFDRNQYEGALKNLPQRKSPSQETTR